MGMSSIVIVSLAAGIILIVGGGLIMYMGNLIRSAYEIKVQIVTDTNERITKLIEEMDKRTKWAKREAAEEVERFKTTIEVSNASSMEDLQRSLQQRVTALETLIRNGRNEWITAVEGHQQALVSLEANMNVLLKMRRRTEDSDEQPDATAERLSAALATLDAAASEAAGSGETTPSVETPSPASPEKKVAAGGLAVAVRPTPVASAGGGDKPLPEPKVDLPQRSGKETPVAAFLLELESQPNPNKR